MALGLVLVAALGACGGGDGSALTAEPTTPTPSNAVTPGLGEALQVIDGVEVAPLEFGGEAELPEDVALIVELGCTGCDGPTTGLARVYRDSSGQVRTDTLFSVEEMGLPPRLVKTSKGTEEWEPMITGFALRAGGGEIAVSVCTRGFCLEIGEPPSSDAQTALFQSTDGGVTWRRADLEGGPDSVVAMTREGVVLAGLSATWAQGGPQFQLFPTGQRVEMPKEAGISWPVSLPSGELLWPSEDGRLLRSDGSQFLALPVGFQVGWLPSRVLFPDPGGERYAAAVWVDRPEEYGVDYYLGLFDAAGGLTKAFSLDGLASVGGWLNSGLAVGNAVVLADQLTTAIPDPFVGALPVLFDLDAGRVYPILDPFLEPPFRNGRNHVLAVLQGPFARVVNTGGCLNVRAEPGATGEVLGCAAEGVLLRDAGETREADGVTWLRLVTPGGVEGWASTAYLER